jgi:hypothetical protein
VNVVKTIVAALSALLVAGCGSFAGNSTALSTGQVTGQLTGAKAGAYAYVFGKPELRAKIADDGSFKIDNVPLDTLVKFGGAAGDAQVVVFDGDVKAELVGLKVEAAKRTHVDRDSAAMPRAATVVAAVRCTGGQKGDRTAFTIEGTEFQKHGGGEAVALFPVPPGVFNVRTSLSGFKDSTKPVTVVDGDDAQVELDMDADENDSHRGCLSTSCSSGLMCSGDDGRCYQCTKDAECGAGLTCEEHTCVPALSSGEKRSACLACNVNSDCAAGADAIANRGLCISMPSGGQVCSHQCDPTKTVAGLSAPDVDCPSGYACTANAGGTGVFACKPQTTCYDVLTAFGVVCSDDALCSTALADAKCQGLLKVGHDVLSTGYCTSRCSTDADCPAARGFKCDAGAGVCTK